MKPTQTFLSICTLTAGFAACFAGWGFSESDLFVIGAVCVASGLFGLGIEP